MVLHRPQAVYYGLRNGRFLPNGSPDDVIRGSERDATLLRSPEALESDDVIDGGVEEERAPAQA